MAQSFFAIGAIQRLDRLDHRVGRWDLEFPAQLDKPPDLLQGNGAVGVDKAVVAHFHESFGQNMLQKSPDELHGTERYLPRSSAADLAIADRHGATLHRRDPVIGDGDFRDLRHRIFQGLLVKIQIV